MCGECCHQVLQTCMGGVSSADALGVSASAACSEAEQPAGSCNCAPNTAWHPCQYTYMITYTWWSHKAPSTCLQQVGVAQRAQQGPLNKLQAGAAQPKRIPIAQEEGVEGHEDHSGIGVGKGSAPDGICPGRAGWGLLLSCARIRWRPAAGIQDCQTSCQVGSIGCLVSEHVKSHDESFLEQLI